MYVSILVLALEFCEGREPYWTKIRRTKLPKFRPGVESFPSQKFYLPGILSAEIIVFFCMKRFLADKIAKISS